MKLKVESRLQLEPPKQLGNERILVKVIGYLKGASLLVTAPTTANGARLQLMEGERVVMRSFSGQNAFAFACSVERACKLPYEYLHLSFPDVIQGVVIRKAPRVKSKIIVAVQNANSRNPSEQISALISNISANGAALDAKRPLGKKGDILNLAFRVNLHKIDAFLSVKGAIRAVLGGEVPDISNTEITRYGIEFQELQPNDMVILQSMIYQQIIESPHQVV
ncbi:MAG: flagellar brake protein [Gallionella sp.]|nr:flagellar brake protein [Gallionella sp.]